MKLQLQPIESSRERLHSAESYDAMVVGGGITGLAAAHTLAKEGLRIVISEPTGTLGREIVRGRNQFVRLSPFSGVSTSINEFYHYLQQRKGLFNGEIDPSVAAIAFDDLMEKHHIEVLFNVWPSRLLVDEKQVRGAVVVTKTGYSSVKAPRIIDASVHGKISKSWFGCETNMNEKSVLHLIFNGVSGECVAERVIFLQGLGEIGVRCKKTYWEQEWRVSLIASQTITRTEWMLHLSMLLPVLQQQFPALNSGGITLVSEDVWQTPRLRIHTESEDNRMIGCIEDVDGNPFEIRQNMLSDPKIIQGLTMSGVWLKAFPFDPALEEAAIINAFRLGELAGQSLLDSKI